MTRTNDGGLSAAVDGRDMPDAPPTGTSTVGSLHGSAHPLAPSTAQPTLSRRVAREQERQAQRADRRRPAVPTIRRARGPVATVAPVAAQTSTRPPTAPLGRRILRKVTSAGAMLGVAAMLVSTTISGLPFASADPAEAGQTLAEGTELKAPVQSLGVVASATDAGTVERESYEATAYVPPAPPPVRWVSQTYGQTSADWHYTNNPNGTIQWPFVHPAPISYGFGPRNACSYCSSYHLGVDFTPGAGVPIQAIADGVVSVVQLDGGGLGNYVVIDHVINGQRIQSTYAHMAWGSIQVAVGQQVTVGTVVGAVGSTGASTGAHLHLEIRADGTHIDPFAWLKANAN